MAHRPPSSSKSRSGPYTRLRLRQAEGHGAASRDRPAAGDGVTPAELAVLLQGKRAAMSDTDTAQPPRCAVSVDSFRCNACGACVETAPENFVLDPAVDKARETASPVACSEALERAAAFCPRKCISVKVIR